MRMAVLFSLALASLALAADSPRFKSKAVRQAQTEYEGARSSYVIVLERAMVDAQRDGDLQEMRKLQQELTNLRLADAGSDGELFNGHRYRLVKLQLSWHEAAGLCEQFGGHLATLTDPAEARFVTELAGSTSAWIGGTDEGTEGHWRWVTNEEWKFAPWINQPRQPDNAKGEEHFIHLHPRQPGFWNDAPNATTLVSGFICEWE